MSHAREYQSRVRDAMWRASQAREGRPRAPEARLDLPTLQPTAVAGDGWRYDLVYADLRVQERKQVIEQLFYELWADVLEAGLYGPPKDKTP